MEQSAIAAGPVTLEVTRIFDAPRERVFRAWSSAEELAQWFAPSPLIKTVVPELELRVGGRYVVEMHHNDGNVSRVTGTYREITPPEKLSFTWRWTQREFAETLVSVYFRDLGSSTELRLVHELLPNAEEREKHNHGWNGCFESLTKFV